MKRFLSILAVLVLTLSLFTATASAKTTVLSGGSHTTRYNADTVVKAVSLARGKTVKAWAFSFSDQTTLYKYSTKRAGIQIKYIKLKDAVGTVKAKVTSGSDWLTAKVKSGKIYLTVKGKNTSTASKTAIVTVTDKKGDFGTIKVIRGGIHKFTSIKQVGKKIQLKISYASGMKNNGFLAVRVYDKKGELVNATIISNDKRLNGTTYVDDMTKLKAGYTYVYTIGYVPSSVNCGFSSGAAAIKVVKANGNATGKVKVCASSQSEFNNPWLLSILK
ncbi:MAG: hypothetical protein IJ662_00835 [Clostridia bacterium]|nr:hypothetical protein [Clostridia bacterium]